jgi:alkylation response protein AidB-like acyl-CoA dehydrogenase
VTATTTGRSGPGGVPVRDTGSVSVTDTVVDVETDTDLTAFREEVRAWLADHVPADWTDRMRGASREEHVEFQRWWMQELASGGYLAAHWSREWGGAELDFDRQFVLYQEMARAHAPRLSLYLVGLHHAYHTLIEEGTLAQQQELLPGVLEGEVWCQGFSEPDAGSDLAALRTRAVLDGDEYVVNGQKIWSSYAENARWCLLLVRTDPAAPKHRGITYLICDLTAPGVEVRTIKQANGNEEFAEVFLTDVRIPVARRIGDENDGWRIAQVTLSSERGPGAVELVERMRATHRDLVHLAIDRFGPAEDWPTDVALDVATLWFDVEALSRLCLTSIEKLRAGITGWDSSIVKLAFSELLQRINLVGAHYAGVEGLVDAVPIQGEGWNSGNWMLDYVGSYEWTIAGGANEIQRNLLSERALGLPREPKWSQG